MKKKVEFELVADYIDWKEMLEKLNEITEETCKDISSLEISYKECEDNDC